MDLQIIRLLRTPYSERYLLRRHEADIAALDLHYLSQPQQVHATLIIFEDSGVTEGQIPGVLSQLDEVLLPDVSVQEKNLVFTVVMGKVLGAFAAEPPATPH